MSAQVRPAYALTVALSAVGTLKAQLILDQQLYCELGFGENVILANTVFTYLGTVTDTSELPDNPNNGNAYMVESEETYYAWMGEHWVDIGAATMCEQLTSEQKAYLKSLVDG